MDFIFSMQLAITTIAWETELQLVQLASSKGKGKKASPPHFEQVVGAQPIEILEDSSIFFLTFPFPFVLSLLLLPSPFSVQQPTLVTPAQLKP